MERCPTCRARLKGADVCPRCQTDLSRVLEIAKRAEFLCQYAVARLQRQDIKPAVWAMKKALQLQRSKLALFTQQFMVQRLERQAVALLENGKPQQAAETLELILSLKKTPFAQALQAFIKQPGQDTGSI